MATSGVSAIRIIIRLVFNLSYRLFLQHTHVPRLIPLITSNCTSKSVAVRRGQSGGPQVRRIQTHPCSLLLVGVFLPSNLTFVSSRTYWGLRNHFPAEADALYNSLEPSYQKTLQSCLKSSGSVASLPQSDRSSSSSQESLK
ncbi:hypothetical protein GOODEAATRI_012370 [Goodea atripinnis]|uniref:Uncharacterized protein n=1 Tax=Goodea atripinnis TaxID=208336 RepID=A0ABV0NTZ4_9TELE